MASSKTRTNKKSAPAKATSTLMVRLDADSKRWLAQAAELRRISISDYVRTVTVPQAKREVNAANAGVIAMTPDEQLRFWNALSSAPKITPAQRKLGAIIRGEQ